MKLKKLLIIIIIISTLFFTGCWSSHEVSTLAITLCIGIDKSENGYLVSVQVINPKSIASNKATNESPIVVFTSEGKSIDEAIQRITTQSSRSIYLSQLRMVVIGEVLAREGIKNIPDYISRNQQYRTDFYFVIAKNAPAYEILSVITPIEVLPGVNMFDSLTMSSEEWAPTKAVRLVELINSIDADGINPVLTGIEITESEYTSNSIENLKESSKIKTLEYTGLGAFKEDKLIGWMDENESKGYNYITGNITRTVGHVEYGDEVKVSVEVVYAKSSIKASLVNEKPAIDIEIEVTQNIRSVEGDFDISDEENMKIVNKLSAKKLLSFCSETVQKAQKEFKSDIFGFGEIIRRTYPKLWGEIKDDWNNEFLDLPVNIIIKVKTDSLGQISKPYFAEEKE